MVNPTACLSSLFICNFLITFSLILFSRNLNMYTTISLQTSFLRWRENSFGHFLNHHTWNNSKADYYELIEKKVFITYCLILCSKLLLRLGSLTCTLCQMQNLKQLWSRILWIDQRKVFKKKSRVETNRPGIPRELRQACNFGIGNNKQILYSVVDQKFLFGGNKRHHHVTALDFLIY